MSAAPVPVGSGAAPRPSPARDAVVILATGLIGSAVLFVAGAGPGSILIPTSIAMLIGLAIVPFPMVDRWFGLAFVATFPILPPIGLPNLPVGAGVLAIATWRIARLDGRRPSGGMLGVLGALWAFLAVGLALQHWPPLATWMRPAFILGLAAVASCLGLLVWRDEDRWRRWLDGMAVAVVIVAASALLFFALQYVRPIPSIVDALADVVGHLRGESAGAKFDAANNWLIVGDGVTLRAVSPIFPSPNNLGGYLGLLLPILGVHWLTARDRPWRIVAGMAVLLAILTMLVTFSRSTWLAMGLAGAVGGVCVLAYRLWSVPGWPSRQRIGTAIGLAIVAMAIGAGGLLTTGHQAAEDRVTNVLEDVGVTTRIEITGEAIASVGRDPLRGAGLGNWDAALTEGRGRAYIHNVYLEYATATGLFGFAWSLLIVLVPIGAGGIALARRSPPTVRLIALGIVMSMVFAATQFLFDDNLLNPQYAWLHLWLVGGSLGLLRPDGPS